MARVSWYPAAAPEAATNSARVTVRPQGKPPSLAGAGAADVTGRGASLGLRWILYNQPERHALSRSTRVQGTTDWTRLTAEIHGPVPDAVSAVEIVLRLDGAGSVWFDDIDVEILELESECLTS